MMSSTLFLEPGVAPMPLADKLFCRIRDNATNGSEGDMFSRKTNTTSDTKADAQRDARAGPDAALKAFIAVRYFLSYLVC